MNNTVTAPIAAAAESGFFSKIFCCNCKQSAVLGSLAISVAGVALSIFLESMLGIVGFVLLGLFSLIFRSINNAELEKLEAQLEREAEDNVAKMANLTSQMNAQVTQLTHNREEMQAQLLLLQADNGQKQAMLGALQADQVRLTQEMDALRQTKAQLEQDLTTMRGNAQQIRTQVQMLLQQNLQLGTQVGVFDQIVGNLGHHKAELEAEVAAFQQQFNGDLANLTRQIELSTTISRNILNSVSQKNEAFKIQLQQNSTQIQDLQIELQSTQQGLAMERQKIEQDVKSLTEREQLLVQKEEVIQAEELAAQARLAQLQQVETNLIQKLNQLNAKIMSDQTQFDEKMEKLKEDFTALSAQYDRTIGVKQQQLLDLKAQKKQLQNPPPPA